MRRAGHNITGLAAGLIVAGQTAVASSDVVLVLLGGWLGGTAPDWLEPKFFGRRLIPHRRVTHWTLAWVCALGWLLTHEVSPLLTGFCAGGLAHCLADLPNPMGVPLIHPWRQSSLNWWRSGEHDTLISIVFIGVGFWLFCARL